MNVPIRRPSRLLMRSLVALLLPALLLSSASYYATKSEAQGLVYVDWAQAGYPGDIPDVTNSVINVKDFGALGDGSADDFGAIQSAVDGAPNPGVVWLPAGTYRIESQLTLKSGVVLRGEGYESTHLECLNASGCIGIEGSLAGSFVNLQGSLAKGSAQIVVSDASSFTVGQGGQIQQEDIVPASASWGEYAVGQMVKILAIDGNTLTIDPPLHIDYDLAKNPTIRPVRYIDQVGIEDLHLKRIPSGESSDGSNVNIRRAADCWVRRVESDNTEKYHFAVSESLHLEIRDSYIHDAESKGDGGEGYGTSLGRHVTSVLVENNIFDELRHSMILQVGTNGCVFGYNYAQRNYSDDGWDKAYISLHGHYPFANLFEGNVVGLAYLGDYWGDIGPDNTLFRNRVVGTDKHEGFGPYRGIALRYFHGPQYIVGNEVTGSDGIYYASDSTGDPADVVVHGNNVLGEITWDPVYPGTLAASYYLSSKPDFYGAMAWPSIGGDMVLGEGTIPALVRWEEGNYIPSPAEPSPTLHLSAIPADRTIHLVWTVNTSLLPTSTWQIDYGSQTGTAYLPITGIISPTRAYALTDLANYVSYTITLRAMLDAVPVLSDTVRAMPSDHLVYLPLAMRDRRP